MTVNIDEAKKCIRDLMKLFPKRNAFEEATIATSAMFDKYFEATGTELPSEMKEWLSIANETGTGPYILYGTIGRSFPSIEELLEL